jgi:uncharacterized membrane protein
MATGEFHVTYSFFLVDELSATTDPLVGVLDYIPSTIGGVTQFAGEAEWVSLLNASQFISCSAPVINVVLISFICRADWKSLGPKFVNSRVST